MRKTVYKYGQFRIDKLKSMPTEKPRAAIKNAILIRRQPDLWVIYKENKYVDAFLRFKRAKAKVDLFCLSQPKEN